MVYIYLLIAAPKPLSPIDSVLSDRLFCANIIKMANNSFIKSHNTVDQTSSGPRTHRQRSPLSSRRHQLSTTSPTDRFLAFGRDSSPYARGFILGDVPKAGLRATHPGESPPISPLSRPGRSSQEKWRRRSRSPVRSPVAMDQASIKSASPSDVEMLSAQSSCGTISEISTEVAAAYHHDPRLYHHDFPHLISPSSEPLLLRQRILFEKLLDICTSAARNYRLNRIDSSNSRRTRVCHHLPYNRSSAVRSSRSFTSQQHLNWSTKHQRELDGYDQETSVLFSYLHPIVDALWSSTRSSISRYHPYSESSRTSAHAAEAAHRMHNLYLWAERVVSAVETVRRGELVRDEESIVDHHATATPRCKPRQPLGTTTDDHQHQHQSGVEDGRTKTGGENTVTAAILAARDICTWCLCEGQKAVEEVWEEWAVATETETVAMEMIKGRIFEVIL